MPNKPFPAVPKDKVLGPYPMYVPVSDTTWLVSDGGLWAIYDPDQELFLSRFLYEEYTLPKSPYPNYLTLHLPDGTEVTFDVQSKSFVICG